MAPETLTPVEVQELSASVVYYLIAESERFEPAKDDASVGKFDI